MKALPSYPNHELQTLRFRDGVERPNMVYSIACRVLQLSISLGNNLRIYNRHFEPTEGSAIYICNHQSFLDPVMMGMALKRPMNFMARDSLFRIPLLGRFIKKVYSFPVRRGTADLGAMKEAMRRLKSGGQLAVFAEGTRTDDGHIKPFLPGVAMLAQRAARWTIPVLIDGAYEAWPRSQKFPGRGNINVIYGRPIPQKETRKYDSGDFVEHMRQILIEMQNDIRLRTGREPLKY